MYMYIITKPQTTQELIHFKISRHYIFIYLRSQIYKLSLMTNIYIYIYIYIYIIYNIYI